LACLTLGVWAYAQAQWQSLDPIRQAARTYVQAQVGTSPGKVETSIGTIDPRLHLPQCTHLEAFLPPGSRLWGNTTVGVRCLAPSTWSIYVPVTVKIFSTVVVSARPLARGQTLTAEDLAIRTEDLTQLPAGILTDPAQAAGMTTTSSLPAGYALRTDMLRAHYVILQGQTVRIVSQGKGFQVSSEGKALGNGSVGQIVSVRTRSGQVVSGIAQPNGVVEVQAQ
jgi:flagella basal body P-ring formation protein FlgA